MDRDQIELIIKAHLKWREDLLKFSAGKTNFQWSINPGDVGNYNICELGKWLNSLSKSDIDEDVLKKLIETHQAFHFEAKRLYDLACNKKFDEISTSMSSSIDDFSFIALTLITTLRSLK